MTTFADNLFEIARAEGDRAATACLDKAERGGFDGRAAASCIVEHLRQRGDTSGEELVDAAIAVGHRPHDQRAYGSVFGSLARRGVIRCVGYADRRKGHGTSGARRWALTKGATA